MACGGVEKERPALSFNLPLSLLEKVGKVDTKGSAPGAIPLPHAHSAARMLYHPTKPPSCLGPCGDERFGDELQLFSAPSSFNLLFAGEGS